jgi:hypothetical protein
MRKLLFIFLLSCTLPYSHAQILRTRLDFAGGLSAREYLHAGIRYQYTDFTQLGLFYGGDMGIRTEIIRTYCLDNMIHFGPHSYHTNRAVWYARQGFTYSENTVSDRIYKYSYVNLSAGREFGFGDRLGVILDMGVILQLMERTVYKSAGYSDRFINAWFILPLARIQFFYSL